MLLKRWEPLADLKTIDRHIDRMWRHFDMPYYLWRRPFVEDIDGAQVGNLDVYHQGDNLVVKAEVPGMKPEDLEVTIAEDTLTIKGETRSESEVKEEDYIHRERRYGSFRRVINLPKGHLAERAEGRYENGVLTITIPQGEEAKPKTIKVDVSK